MKNSIFVLLVLTMLISCTESGSDIGMEKQTPIIYRSNSPSIGANNTISISSKDGIVTAERTYGHITENDPDNILYSATDVKTEDLGGGKVLISDKKGDLWFIPFMVSTEPVLINSSVNKCAIYYCTCGGFPGQQTAGCVAINTGVELSCSTFNSESCLSRCLGYVIEVPCNTNAAELDLSHTYTGGVLVRAQKVNIIDPPGYEVSAKTPGTKFYVKPDGVLIEYEEALKNKLIKPTETD